MSNRASVKRGTCRSRSFVALLCAQFVGALNDNLFKLFVTLLVVRDVLSEGAGISHLVLINICFISPYILFSTIAGGLADKFSKTKLLRAAKTAEVLIMLAAAYFLAREQSMALLVVLFLMGMQSTLFSPSKYGILPELLDDAALSKGNGYLEFATFIGIIFGTGLAGLVLSLFSFSSGVPGTFLVVLAVLGCSATFGIRAVAPAAPSTQVRFNPLSMAKAAWELRTETGLYLSVLAISYFWAIGALYQLNLVLFGRMEAGLGDLAVSLQLAALGLGIGIGSVVAGKVSEGKVELGLVPLGALGLAFWSMLLSVLPGYPFLSGLCMGLVGFSAGFYIVPLNAFLQKNSPDATRGKCLAACNFLSFSGMLLSSVLLLVGIDYLGMQPSGIFFLAGLSALGIGIYICSVLPEVLLRCVNWLLMHLVYRIEVEGEEHVPQEGGALLVCNHVSMVDACLLLASLTRPVRFLMYRPYYENRFVHPFAKVMGTIPIEAGSKATGGALAGASEAIDRGELVGIFAEGAITRTGQMLRFRTGLERIMEPVDAPIIPVHLDQVWGSVFSFRNGRFFWKIPRKIPYPVRLTFGPALAADANAAEVRQAVQELSVDAFKRRTSARQSLFRAFCIVAKNNGLRTALVLQNKRVSYYRILIEVLAMVRVLDARFPEEKNFCISGAASAEAVVLHLAVLARGGAAVPIDEAVTGESIVQVQQAFSISYCLCAHADVHCPDSVSQVLYCDLQSSLCVKDKALAALQTLLLPSWCIERFVLPQFDASSATAAVVFSRGNTGKQKLIELTHQNILFTASAFQELFNFQNDDLIAADLPWSHAMGYSSCMWLPLLSGCRAVYPLAALPAKQRLRFLFLTAKQLEDLLRDEARAALLCNAARYVVVGGDEIDVGVREHFYRTYSSQLLEGYGASELSPLAILNVPDVQEGRTVQVGQKLGMLGHPLPGVAIKVVADAAGSACGPGEEGELWVKGPNVMKGYVGEGVEAPLCDGWLRTGDRAVLDTDGFVAFRGRME